MRDFFKTATGKLTVSYIVILVVISLLFSIILFALADAQFHRALGPRRSFEQPIFIDSNEAEDIREQRIEESRASLVFSLLFFNIVVLGVGGACSYLLALQTVKPIEEALESQRRFSSDAAHELRTPLAVMQSEIEVGLRDTAATKAEYKNALISNLEEVQRLRTLTDRLLLLAHNKDIPLDEVQLDEVTIEAIHRTITLAQTKKMTIQNNVMPCIVRANFESLVDVVVVLLDNAIKYSPHKSIVSVSSKKSGKFVTLSVSDEGRGIAPTDGEHIFDRFYRADQSRSKAGVEGYGLGLSIAKRLIDAHGGKISYKNNPTKGAIFTISIPLKSGGASNAA